MSSPYTTYPTIPSGSILRQPGAKLKVSREGVAVLTETYRGNFVDLISDSSFTVVGTAHADFPLLTVWTNTITEDKAGIGTLEVEYRGPLAGDYPEPIYSLDRATHNEPLSTHPLWVSNIAGTPASPLNGAIFVDPTTGAVSTSSSAVFKGWTTGSIFEGVEDYLLAGSTWSSSYIDNSPPDLTGVGKIGTPDGPAPSAPDGYFWLFTGGSSSQQGNVYHCQKTWLLTGGLNSDATTIIYNT
jgi:hypothetical protein